MPKKKEEYSLKEKWDEHIKLIEDKTGIKGNIVLSILFGSLFFVYMGVLERFITNMIGTFYPAYWSMKAIESENCDDDKQWLTYWVVFAIFTIFDIVGGGFVIKLIPFYFIFKMIFLVWLFMPNFRGATILYNLIIVRLFSKYERHIDDVSEQFKQGFDKLVQNGEGVISSPRDINYNIRNASRYIGKQKVKLYGDQVISSVRDIKDNISNASRNIGKQKKKM